MDGIVAAFQSLLSEAFVEMAKATGTEPEDWQQLYICKTDVVLKLICRLAIDPGITVTDDELNRGEVSIVIGSLPILLLRFDMVEIESPAGLVNQLNALAEESVERIRHLAELDIVRCMAEALGATTTFAGVSPGELFSYAAILFAATDEDVMGKVSASWPVLLISVAREVIGAFGRRPGNEYEAKAVVAEVARRVEERK